MNTHRVPNLTAAARTVRTWLGEADRVLVTAGSGLSAAAGYDYGDQERLKELFPALHRMGLRSRYIVGVHLPPALWWGYWAVHIDDIRYTPGPNPLHQRLRALVADKEHWVMTSNVDALFARNGFAPERIFTPQGDYGRCQCTVPCLRTTWDSHPLVKGLLAAYDPATGAITDPAALPHCPNCGENVEINVRIGPQFVDEPYLPAGNRLQEWLNSADNGTRLLILEFGAGFNTPDVIRTPGEHLTRHLPNTRLVRINPSHPQTPADLRRPPRTGPARPVRHRPHARRTRQRAARRVGPLDEVAQTSNRTWLQGLADLVVCDGRQRPTHGGPLSGLAHPRPKPRTVFEAPRCIAAVGNSLAADDDQVAAEPARSAA